MLATVGCGSSSSDPADPLDLLRAGVELENEASSSQQSLERAGYTLARVQRGQSFIALDMRAANLQRAIRIITSRGTAASLDAFEPNGVVPRDGQIELADHPRPYDLDQNGLEDVIVGAAFRGHSCLLPLAIDPEGIVRPLPPDLGPLAHHEACMIRFDSTEGQVVPIGRWHLTPAGARIDARLDFPMELSPGGRCAFRIAPEAWSSRLEADLQRQWVEARSARDGVRIVELALELAGCVRLRGGTAEAISATLRTALEGIEIPPDLAPEVAQASASMTAFQR